jgi:hypothetical protein|tara:strand:+ start:526 stop:885 length:360 start_codon:yes stop_codon:yes gene_type:complete
MATFTETFDKYVCVGDSVSVDVNGFTVEARLEHDPDTHLDDYDCYDDAARKAWLNDDWFFGSVVLAVLKNDVVLDEHAASLSGVDVNFPGSDNSYLTDVANELLDEALVEGRAVLARLV